MATKKKTKKAKKSDTEFHWNHRVVRYPAGELGIHEAHYHGRRVKVPNVITMHPIAVVGANKKELKETLERMLRCLDKPVLLYKKFVKAEKEKQKKAAKQRAKKAKKSS